MPYRSPVELKQFFNNGQKPPQEDFWDLIDTTLQKLYFDPNSGSLTIRSLDNGDISTVDLSKYDTWTRNQDNHLHYTQGKVGIGMVPGGSSTTLEIQESGSDPAIITLRARKDAAIHLIADTDNVDENDTAYILFSQDAGQHQAVLGLIGEYGKDPQQNVFTGAFSNSVFLGSTSDYPLQLGTNGAVWLHINGNTPNRRGFMGIANTGPDTRLTVGSIASSENEAVTVISQKNAALILSANTNQAFPNGENHNPHITLKKSQGYYSAVIGIVGDDDSDPETAISSFTGAKQDGLIIGTRKDQVVQLGTEKIVRMTIDGNGAVGVGTSQPEKRFHIRGVSSRIQTSQGSMTMRLTDTYIHDFTTPEVNHDWDFVVDRNKLHIRSFEDASPQGTHVTVTHSGRVGINKDNPGRSLHVNGSFQATEFRLDSGEYITDISDEEDLGDDKHTLVTERAIKKYVDEKVNFKVLKLNPGFTLYPDPPSYVFWQTLNFNQPSPEINYPENTWDSIQNKLQIKLTGYYKFVFKSAVYPLIEGLNGSFRARWRYQATSTNYSQQFVSISKFPNDNQGGSIVDWEETFFCQANSLISIEVEMQNFQMAGQIFTLFECIRMYS